MMRLSTSWKTVLLAVAVCVAMPSYASEQNDSEQKFPPKSIQFFENEIRPLLAEQCFECHSKRSKKLKGGLRLDHRAGLLEGGDSGAAVVPGKPQESLLIQAVHYDGLEMPPERRLKADQIAKLEKWVKLGAPFPGGDDSAGATEREAFSITDEDRAYWAYQPVEQFEPAAVPDEGWNDQPVDRLVFARMAEKDLQPNPPAEPRQLIRRLYFDLIGLPPTAEQIDLFVRDPSAAAYEAQIDHLLSLPQYGERWGRHWLDLVRFAQSNGYERDGEKPLVWHYRDYVIKAFNDDKPYDRFVREQLAGDELSDASADSVAATGFYRLGVWDDEPDDKRAAEFDGLDDMVSTVGQVFLGQTIGCARCHDHMFDPISQKDYYELLSFVRNVKYYQNSGQDFGAAGFAPLAAPSEVVAFQKAKQLRVKELERKRGEAENDEAKKKLEEEIKRANGDKGSFEWTLAVREHGTKPKESKILIRGDAATPGDTVEPRFLAVLGDVPAEVPTAAYGMSSGLRLQLADWVAAADNPLTARVMANRVWQHLFGRAIVKTPNDFGKAGVLPTHPQLLDWLAADLVENGWSVKKLLKTILMSRVYRMSSQTRADAQAVDPGNDWFWRQNLRRLDAEAIRDAMLFVSGELDTKMGGRGFFPKLSSEVLAGQSKPGWGWGVSDESERNRRSVYIFTKRGMRDPLIESFDYVNTAQPLGVRPVTTVAPQALVLLNGRFVQRQTKALAAKIESGIATPQPVIVERLYRRVLGRSATLRELAFATEYLQTQQSQFKQLESVITIRPDVPNTIMTEFRKKLVSDDYVLGPRHKWSYRPGKWVGGYETVDVLDDDRIPFALWDGANVPQGELHGRLMLHNATRFGSLLINGSQAGDQLDGIELRFDPREDRLVVLRHAKELEEIASVDMALGTSEWIDFRLSIGEKQVRLWLNGGEDPVVEFAGGEIKPEAKVGVAVSRGAMSFDGLTVETSGNQFDVAGLDANATSAEFKALQSLCVVLMNTNEFLYLD